MNEPVGPGTSRSPLRVVGIYASCAAAWIILSDLAIAMSLGCDIAEMWANITKGLLFVAVSSSLLYLLLRRDSDRAGVVGADMEAAQDRFSSAVAQLPFTFAIYDAD
ncbi:MAG: hypothetical protein WCS99_19535, partial [Limisphaerales bacterium]